MPETVTILCLNGPYAGLLHEALGDLRDVVSVHGFDYAATGDRLLAEELGCYVSEYRYVGMSQWLRPAPVKRPGPTKKGRAA